MDHHMGLGAKRFQERPPPAASLSAESRALTNSACGLVTYELVLERSIRGLDLLLADRLHPGGDLCIEQRLDRDTPPGASLASSRP